MGDSSCYFFNLCDDTETDGDADDDCFDCEVDGDADADADLVRDADDEAGDDADEEEEDDDAQWEREATLINFCARLAAITCAGEEACCGAGWSEEGFLGCAERWELDCGSFFGDSVREGRIEIAPARLDDCMDAVHDAIAEPCYPAGPPLALGSATACRDLLRGTVDHGGSCAIGLDCLPALDCSYDDASAAEGTCSDPLGEGDPCVYGCGRGLECRSGTCVRPGGVGSDCSGLDADDDTCAQGLYCSEAAVCEGLLPTGHECSAPRACSSSRCENGRCVLEPFDYCWPDV